jgi:hypothetical protein
MTELDYNPLGVLGKDVVAIIDGAKYSDPEELAAFVKNYAGSIKAGLGPELAAYQLSEGAQDSYAPETLRWDDVEEVIRNMPVHGEDEETKETKAYLEEKIEAVSAVLDATTEQIIEYVEGLGIKPAYAKGSVDTEPISPEVRAGLQFVTKGMDPRKGR